MIKLTCACLIIVSVLMMSTSPCIAWHDGGGRGWGPGWGPLIGLGIGIGLLELSHPYYPYPYDGDFAPPDIIQQTGPQTVPPPTAQEPVYWYYCQEPHGYYPYVKQCPGGWIKVIPAPPVP